MEKLRLNTQQMAFMNTFGYLHFPGLLGDCIEEITAAFEGVWEMHGGGHEGQPHDGQQRSCLVPFIDQSERLSALLDDGRVDGIFASLLGDEYQYIGSDGNYYVGDTGWHSDGGWPRPIIYYKLALYLDPLTATTGALRVIPGSHRYGEGFAEAIEGQIRQSQEHWGIGGAEVPCVALETQPGDVVVFNQGIKHSAWGGGKRRRMFTINCTPKHREDQIGLMREEISAFARFLMDELYGEAMLKTAGPERMKHLEQGLANDDHLPALTARARAERTEASRG